MPLKLILNLHTSPVRDFLCSFNYKFIEQLITTFYILKMEDIPQRQPNEHLY